MVPVVDIRVVRMPVQQLRVAVPVHVRLFAVPVGPVLMPVVFVVHVAVLMLHRLVQVPVLVPLAEVQPYAGKHQRGGGPTIRVLATPDRDFDPDTWWRTRLFKNRLFRPFWPPSA